MSSGMLRRDISCRFIIIIIIYYYRRTGGKHSASADIGSAAGAYNSVALYTGWSNVTESIATTRSSFCGYNMA